MDKNKFIAGKKPAQAMVEFAIALPLLLLLLYGILEAGRLLFLYSTVVTASRQAARYGSATGEGNNGVFRYQDCKGMRDAANAVGYLGQFDSITFQYDTGPSTNPSPLCVDPNNPTDSSFDEGDLNGNKTRIIVTVQQKFQPLVNLVPFFERDIIATSARTVLYSVPIVVEQEQQEWYKTPTITAFTAGTADIPDPSEIYEYVLVTVTVTGGSPTGNVEITGADENCTAPIVGNTASCSITFHTAGSKLITAFYPGDADHMASSSTEEHEVTLLRTTLTILSDLPDPSVKDEKFDLIVQVTNNTDNKATGTVDVDGGNGVKCTITLSNGAGSCPLSYNNVGNKTITATYGGDSSHLGSSDTEPHSVIIGTPTPTNSPTATLPPTSTPIPVATLTPSPTATPTLPPSPVPGCNLVTQSAIGYSGNTMTVTITNPYIYTITMSDLTVTWNDDKGHLIGNKQLNLQKANVGATTIWSGNVSRQSTYTIPTTATLPPGPTVITFYFNQSYDVPEKTDSLLINLSTPGCVGTPISPGQ